MRPTRKTGVEKVIAEITQMPGISRYFWITDAGTGAGEADGEGEGDDEGDGDGVGDGDAARAMARGFNRSISAFASG